MEALFFKRKNGIPRFAPAVDVESTCPFFVHIFAIHIRSGTQNDHKFAGLQTGFHLQFKVVAVGFAAVAVGLHNVFHRIGVVIFHQRGEFTGGIHLADVDLGCFGVPQAAFHIAGHFRIEGIFYTVSHTESFAGMDGTHSISQQSRETERTIFSRTGCQDRLVTLPRPGAFAVGRNRFERSQFDRIGSNARINIPEVVNIGVKFAVDLAGAGVFAGHNTGAPLFFENAHRGFQIERFRIGAENSSGGSQHCQILFHFRNPFCKLFGIFRMSGGCFAPSNTESIFSNSAVVDVKVTGGEVVLKDGAAVENRGVFPDGAVLTLGNNCVLRNLGTAENPDLPLNGGEVRGNGRFIASTNFNITGGGHLTFGGGMNLSPGNDDPIERVVLDIDSLVLGTHLQRPHKPGDVGDTIGTNLHIYFPREVVIGATNSNWDVLGLKTAMHIEKGLTIDTTDRADGTTGRQITLRRPTFSYGAYLRTIGSGTGFSSLWSDPGERISELSIGDGSTAKFELQYNKTLKTDLLSVGDGAFLGVASRRKVAFFEAEAFSFENNSRILASVSIGNHTDPIVPGFIGGPLAIDAFNDGVSPQLDFTKEAYANTWDYKFVNGSLVFCRKNVDLLTEYFSGNRWIGHGDGRFDNSDNWSGGVVPEGTNTTAVFDGI